MLFIDIETPLKGLIETQYDERGGEEGLFKISLRVLHDTLNLTTIYYLLTLYIKNT